MRFLLTLFLLLPLTVGATTYTEFYVQTTGSNLNSGHTTDDAATYTGTGGNWTNNTSASVGTWFKSGENLSGVTNGAWAALYTDGTATNAQFIGLITAVSDAADTITISLVASGGSNPSTVVAGMSVKVGGAWAGPNTNQNPSIGFPFGAIVNGNMTNGQSIMPCVNFKTGTYSVTNAITHSGSGPLLFCGYNTSPRDEGARATLDGGTVYPSFALFTCSGNTVQFQDFIFSNNGASGASDGVTLSGNAITMRRCVIHDIGRAGLVGSGSGSSAIECEAYNCDKSNTSGRSAFSTINMCIRCIAHDNTAANCNGFSSGSGSTAFIGCISESNGRAGISSAVGASGVMFVYGCDLYNNTHSGIELTGVGIPIIENCNFVKNGFGITNTSTTLNKVGEVINCGFGSGTMANTGGDIANVGGLIVSGSKTYAADSLPWTDAPNGNFTLTSAAKSLGRGAFTETAASYTGTVGYPDIGAAQSPSTNAAAASGGSYTWSQ